MWRGCIIMLVVVPLLFCGTPLPADEPDGPAAEPAFRIGLETWLSSGDSSWEISFRELFPEIGVLDGRSLLEWEDLDSLIYRLHAEYRFTEWFRLSAAYGFGRIDDGVNTDTDWFAQERSEIMFAKSVAETSGDVTLLDLNAAFRLNELLDFFTIPGDWDAVVGFRYYEEDLRDRNGRMTVFLNEPAAIPLDGLDSTYKFEWSAVRLGLRGQIPVTDRIRAHGEAMALLGIRFEGEGFWNLREDFRDESPNFEQEASSGTGAELKASLVYDFTPRFHGEIGYWWFRMRAKNGSDTIFFADGSLGVSQLDEVKTERHGFFIGLGGRF